MRCYSSTISAKLHGFALFAKRFNRWLLPKPYGNTHNKQDNNGPDYQISHKDHLLSIVNPRHLPAHRFGRFFTGDCPPGASDDIADELNNLIARDIELACAMSMYHDFRIPTLALMAEPTHERLG